MRLIRKLWHRWCLSVAREELATFQARFDVGPQYLCNMMIHINNLERRIAELT